MDRASCIDFFDSLAAQWDERQNPLYAARIPDLLAKVVIKQGEAVLDAGCGTGVLYPYLKQAGAFITALDISPQMLAELKKKHPDAQTVCGCFITADLPAESFDKIIIFNAFPHFEDKHAAAAKAFALLKQGGALYILHSLTRAELNRVHGGNDTTSDDLIPNQKDLKLILSYAGFRNILLEEDEKGCFFKAEK